VLTSIVGLFLWGWGFNPVSSLDLLYPANDVVAYLKQNDMENFRVLSLYREERVFGLNILSVFHISTPDGYLALNITPYKELMYSIDPYFQDEDKRFMGPHPNMIVVQNFRPVHSMLGVKYVLAGNPVETPELVHRETLQGVYIYENLDALPLAYVVHRAEVMSEEEVLEGLVSPDFSAADTVFLSEALTERQVEALDKAPVKDHSRVQITQCASNRINILVNMEHAGILVLSNPAYPGWKALVDGQPRDIMRANYALQAVYLGPGRHQVEFVYRPSSVAIAAAVFGGTGILSVLLVLLSARRKAVTTGMQRRSSA
jgi:hypothetical protein